jgi:membrane associated rhomboid family serine protease
VAFIFLLLIIGGVGYRIMTPETRTRVLQTIVAVIELVKDAAVRSRSACEPFNDILRARTPLALVTPGLVVVNATIFVLMIFGAGALNDPETIVRWGGNLGTRTTNGEWWRLVSSMFVHAKMLPLLVNIAGLVQVGFILERLLGRLTFAAVYVAAGIFASLVNLAAYPLVVSAGASGAIFGVYGLLLASLLWSAIQRFFQRSVDGDLPEPLTIPVVALKRLGPAAVLFILYSAANDGLTISAELTGLIVGFAGGLALSRGVGERIPPRRRIQVAMTAAAVMAIAASIPLRGITDARPEIERVVALEARTASTYQTALDRLKNRRITTEALAQMIDGTILPELRATDARLKSLDGVPHEQQSLVARAEEFLRLRAESWRLRADVLRKTNTLTARAGDSTEQATGTGSRLRAEAQYKAYMVTRGRAEGSERASLEAFRKIKPVVSP